MSESQVTKKPRKTAPNHIRNLQWFNGQETSANPFLESTRICSQNNFSKEPEKTENSEKNKIQPEMKNKIVEQLSPVNSMKNEQPTPALQLKMKNSSKPPSVSQNVNKNPHQPEENKDLIDLDLDINNFLASTQKEKEVLTQKVPKSTNFKEPPKIISTESSKIIKQEAKSCDKKDSNEFIITEKDASLIQLLEKIILVGNKTENLLLSIVKQLEEPIELLKFCISHGFDINSCDEKGWTALHEAIKKDDLEVVEFLLKYGAKINISSPPDLSPFEYACSISSWKIIKLMFSYCHEVFVRDLKCNKYLNLIKLPIVKTMVMNLFIDIRAISINPNSPIFQNPPRKYMFVSDIPSLHKNDNSILNISQASEFMKQTPMIFQMQYNNVFMSVIMLEHHFSCKDVANKITMYSIPSEFIIKMTFKQFFEACCSLKESYLTLIKEKNNFFDDQVLHFIDITRAFMFGILNPANISR